MCGQDPYHLTYTTNDGLPSNEVYDLHLMKDGRICMTTDRGVAFYNGYEFETYGTKDGLASNTNFKIEEDPGGNLWFLGYNGSLSIYDGRVFKSHRLNDQIREKLRSPWIRDLYFTESGELYFNGYYQLYIPEHPFELDVYSLSDTAIHPVNLVKNINDTIDQYEIIDFENAPFIAIDGNRVPYTAQYVQGRNTIFSFTSNNAYADKKKSNGLISLESIDNSSFYLVKKNENKIDTLLNIPASINRVRSFDNGKSLFACTSNGLVLVKNINSQSNDTLTYFRGFNCSDIEKDQHGGYWISTIQRGIKYIPSFEIKSLLALPSKSSEHLLSVEHLEDHLIVGSSSNYLYTFDSSFTKSKHTFSALNYFYDLDKYDKQTLYSSNSLSIREKNSTLLIEPLFEYFVYSRNSHRLFNDQLVISRKKVFGSSLIKAETKPIFNFIDSPISNYKHTWSLSSDSTFLVIGGSDSLMVFKINSNQKSKNNRFIFHGGYGTNDRINDIIPINGKFIISSQSEGVFMLDPHTIQVDTLWIPINEKIYINRIYLHNDDRLLFCSNSGIFYANLILNNESDFCLTAIKNINSDDGIPSNYITDITYWKNYFWLSTDIGLYGLGEDFFNRKFTAPDVRIDYIRTNDSSFSSSREIRLLGSDNNIQIKFTGISYRKPSSDYFYETELKKLNGITSVEQTNNREFNISQLNPGTYEFRVRARNKDGDWSAFSHPVRIEVIPKLINKLWFRLLLSALILLGISIYLVNRYRAKEAKVAAQKRLKELELRARSSEIIALRNQMNPHFFFNALNAIQNLVFKGEVVLANEYISKFSRLIRGALNFSKRDWISISEEIAFLKQYVEMEQLRFPNKFAIVFQYHLPCPQDQVLIPPLLLQPLLENSIKHGFKNLERKGILNISFEEWKTG